MSEIKVIQDSEEWDLYVKWLSAWNITPYVAQNNPNVHEGKPDKYPCLVCTHLSANTEGLFDFVHTFAYREDVMFLFEQELVELAKLRNLSEKI